MSEPTKDPHPETSVGTYFGIFLVLVVCTLIAIGSSYIPLGLGNSLIVLTVAVIKAVLTLLFFMHVRNSSRLMKMVIVSGIFTLGVLFVMSYSDYISRAWSNW